jgi:vacuolar-type H+-ATPase subunit I/STV1
LQMARKTRVELSDGRIGANLILLAWVIIAFALISSWIKMNWDRYYIPLIMCSSLLVSVGITDTLLLIEARLKKIY